MYAKLHCKDGRTVGTHLTPAKYAKKIEYNGQFEPTTIRTFKAVRMDDEAIHYEEVDAKPGKSLAEIEAEIRANTFRMLFGEDE